MSVGLGLGFDNSKFQLTTWCRSQFSIELVGFRGGTAAGGKKICLIIIPLRGPTCKLKTCKNLSKAEIPKLDPSVAINSRRIYKTGSGITRPNGKHLVNEVFGLGCSKLV